MTGAIFWETRPETIMRSAWRGVARPEIGRAQALIFAGNHGICAQGVNPYPQEVTAQMVGNFQTGGAAINQLCRANGASLDYVPVPGGGCCFRISMPGQHTLLPA